MKKLFTILSILLFTQHAWSQITIGSGGIVNLNSGTIATAVNGFVNNSSKRILFSDLIIDGGGDKKLTGEWEVTNGLNLKNAILIPQGSGKLVFSGAGGSDRFSVGTGSFVSGTFYSRGTGVRYFPIGIKNGSTATYSPVIFENITDGSDEIGVRVIEGDAGFQLTEAIDSYLTTRYWEIASANPVNSAISLGINSEILTNGSPIVLEASALGQEPTILSGSFDQQFIKSALPVTQSIVGIGFGKEFSIVIHDLLTPFDQTANPDSNNTLFIDNIGLTTSNTVTLLDRWGVVQRVWNNYNNDDPQFDFTKLSPGNYICVVEYTVPGISSRKKETQMITVLRTN